MTYINKALKAVKRMNLPDSIVWQWVGAIFAFLSALLIRRSGAKFKRLEERVDVIEAHYATKDDIKDALAEFRAGNNYLSEKLDRKTESITDMFKDEHKITRDSVVETKTSVSKIEGMLEILIEQTNKS